MQRPRWSSTLPKLAQITEPSSYHLAAPDLFRLWFVRWRRPQLRLGSGRVENVRYGLLGLALTTTTGGGLCVFKTGTTAVFVWHLASDVTQNSRRHHHR